MGEISITFRMPRDEWAAFAQFIKRIGLEDVKRFTNPRVTYGGRTESDVAWYAVCGVQRQLAEGGFRASLTFTKIRRRACHGAAPGYFTK